MKLCMICSLASVLPLMAASSRVAGGIAIWNGAAVPYKVVNGLAVAEGDIVLGTVEQIESTRGKGPERRSIVMREEWRLWSDGLVRYRIDPALKRPERVQEAIKHWEEKTPLRFVERTTERGYITFRDNGTGCNSNIGSTGGEQFINLGSGCDTGATIHEIGHAVGLFHTQSRGDRDRWIHVRLEEADRQYWPQYRQPIQSGRDQGPYPYNSIMHYEAYSASRNGKAVMVSVPPGIPLGSESVLTPFDIQSVNLLYSWKVSKYYVSSTPLGLKVKVDGNEYQTPAEFDWQPGEIHTIAAAPQGGSGEGVRYDLAGWSDGGEAEHTITLAEGERVYDARFKQMLRIEAGVSGEGGGRVTVEPASSDGYHALGSLVRLSAVAEEGNQFVSWCTAAMKPVVYEFYVVGCSQAVMDFDVEAPFRAVASFSSKPLTIVESTPPGRLIQVDGEPLIAPARFAWEPDSEHDLRAVPFDVSLDYGSFFEFEKWSEGSGARVQVKAAAEPRTFTASYTGYHDFSEAYDYMITSGSTRPDSMGLTISPPLEFGMVVDGTEIEVSPPSNDKWTFTNWFGDASGAAVPLRMKVNGPIVLGANYLSPSWLTTSGVIHDGGGQPDATVAPGQRLRIYWAGPAPDEPVVAPEGQPLPTELGGVSVKFDNVAVPLLRASKSEVLCLAPETLAPEKLTTYTVITRGRNGTLNIPLAIARTNPGIYTLSGSGSGAVLDHAVRPGDEIEFTATGLRADEPVYMRVAETIVPATASSEETNPGLWRVRARVPEDALSGAMRLQLVSGGRASQPGVTIEVAR